MITILLLLVFIYNGYAAYRRGLAVEALTALGFVLALLIARLCYKGVGRAITLWIPYPSARRASTFAFFDKTAGLTLDKSFYAAFAFAGITLICFLLWRLIMTGFRELQFVTGEPQVDKWASVLISVIVTQVGCVLVLFILATLPVPGLQSQLGHSILASALLRNSPFISRYFINSFVLAI